MNILVVNDDGFDAPGIRILAETMAAFGTVRVVAPHSQQSGIGHGITIHDPFRLHVRNDLVPGVKSWSLEAKPADCVKFALYGLDLPADLVVSGINDGPNLGTDIIYSGTLAGASEGIICGVPSVAVSTDFGGWDIARAELPGLMARILEARVLSPDYVVNINFPKNGTKASKGVRVCTAGLRPFLHDFVETEEAGVFRAEGTWDVVENHPETDVWAYEQGYTAITPIQINRTDQRALEALKPRLST